MKISMFATGVALTAWMSAAAGQTLRVPEDFATIQAAINAAPAGAVVSVAPGTYGPISFAGKAVEVRSRSGAASTVISAGNQPRYAVTFASNEGRASVLDGFTITGGRGTMTGSPNGGGVRVSGASPTLRNLTVTGNQSIRGAGVCIVGGEPLLSHVVVRQNVAQRGGGLYAESANVAISRSTFERNEALTDGGGVYVQAATLALHDSAVRDNIAQGVGVGMYLGFAAVDFQRVSVESNGVRTASAADPDARAFGGGGIYTYGQVSGVMNAMTVRANRAFAGAGLYLAGEASGLIVANLLATGNVGTLGNGVYFNGVGATVVHATIVNNPEGLGVFAANAASGSLVNSIVSGHGRPSDGWDLAGGSTASVALRSSAVGGRVLSGAILLGTNVAQDAGLPIDTTTFVPRAGGVAVDTGDRSALPAFLKFDLLGNRRVSGAGVDLGAIELQQTRRMISNVRSVGPVNVAP
jgi:predicted outer membrane repeat protein